MGRSFLCFGKKLEYKYTYTQVSLYKKPINPENAILSAAVVISTLGLNLICPLLFMYHRSSCYILGA